MRPQPKAGEMGLKHHPGDVVLRLLDLDHLFSALSAPETREHQIFPDVINWQGGDSARRSFDLPSRANSDGSWG